MPPFKMRPGNTRPAWVFRVEDEDGNPINLTGSTFATVTNPVCFKNVHESTVFYGLGTATVSDPANGEITYTWHANDITDARVDDWMIEITLDVTGAGNTATLEPWDESDKLLIVERFST